MLNYKNKLLQVINSMIRLPIRVGVILAVVITSFLVQKQTVRAETNLVNSEDIRDMNSGNRIVESSLSPLPGILLALTDASVVFDPGQLNKLSPANAVTNQTTKPTLSWSASSNATRYFYCIDTTNNNSCDSSWVSTGTKTSVALRGLTSGTYYWQVRASNDTGITYADEGNTAWWSFSILPSPGAFNKSNPANGASNQPTNLSLSWTASSNATSYKYCIKKTDNCIASSNWITNGTSTSVVLHGLTPGVKYYWQVRAVNNTGTTSADQGNTTLPSFIIALPSTAITPTPTSIGIFLTASPTPTETLVASSPTSTASIVAPTPTPIATVVVSSPSPTVSVVAASPTPTATLVVSSPTSTASIVAPTPPPTATVVVFSPTPTVSVVAASPTSTTTIMAQTPTPTATVVASSPTPTATIGPSSPTPTATIATPTSTPILKAYYVSLTGNDNNPGTFSLPWKTIQKAADTLVAGDTAYIRGGVYQDRTYFGRSGTASSPITIKAYPGETPIVDGNNYTIASNWGVLINLAGDYIDISGLEVRYSGGIGVILTGKYDIADSINSHHNQQNGILISGNYGLVQNCIVWSNSMVNVNGASTTGWSGGLNAARGSISGIVIRNNTVYGNWGEGLSTYETTGTTIEDNIVYDNWATNTYISDATNVLFQRNFIYATGAMVGGDQIGIEIGDEKSNPISNNVTIINNIVYHTHRNLHWWKGLNTVEMDNILIANNTFVDSRGSFNVQISSGTHQNVRFLNNIVSQSDSLPIVGAMDSTVQLGSNLWSKTPVRMGTGDIIGNPLLQKLGSPYSPGWFRLIVGSPAIDMGVLDSVTNDFTGNPRPQHGGYDIGAYEY